MSILNPEVYVHRTPSETQGTPIRIPAAGNKIIILQPSKKSIHEVSFLFTGWP